MAFETTNRKSNPSAKTPWSKNAPIAPGHPVAFKASRMRTVVPTLVVIMTGRALRSHASAHMVGVLPLVLTQEGRDDLDESDEGEERDCPRFLST